LALPAINWMLADPAKKKKKMNLYQPTEINLRLPDEGKDKMNFQLVCIHWESWTHAMVHVMKMNMLKQQKQFSRSCIHLEEALYKSKWINGAKCHVWKWSWDCHHA
jgi:hypothetical protein